MSPGVHGNGVFAGSSTGPGGTQGVIGQFNDGHVTGVADQNGNVQTFSNGGVPSADLKACHLPYSPLTEQCRTAATGECRLW